MTIMDTMLAEDRFPKETFKDILQLGYNLNTSSTMKARMNHFSVLMCNSSYEFYLQVGPR